MEFDMSLKELPLPPHFNPEKTREVWRVEYQNLSVSAAEWASSQGIDAAVEDEFRIALVIVDAQNTFCIPGFELFVGGRSGTGAVEDNRRLCEFIYRNLHRLTQIVPTMDTHQAMQIFHGIFFVNDKGEHPEPYTLISAEDIEKGRWKFNRKISRSLDYDDDYIERHLLHYTRELKRTGKYDLTVWPYHAMLGGIGHALVSSVEEAVFFHSMARVSQPDIHVKGDHPLTEHYSVLGPEVSTGPDGESLSQRKDSLFQKPVASGAVFNKLNDFDAVIIAGQAKSHCVAWTIDDLLEKVMDRDESLVEKIYLLVDCTSPVVVPNVIDYTDEADKAFKKFSDAGMNVVRSTDPINSWKRLVNIE
jgi:nicotinamidase-related amidase